MIPSVSEKHGGPSYAIKSFVRASKLAGIETVVATTDDDGDDARMNVPLNRAVARDGINYFFFRLDLVPYKISFALARWLKRHVAEFDAVHIHALFSFSSFAAARAARKHGVPYVVRPLGVLNRWGMQNRRPLLKRLSLQLVELPLLRCAAAIHYTSQAERLEASQLDPRLAEIPFMIVPIPIEAETASSIDAAASFFRKHSNAAGRKLILFLSRLSPKKGLELLLKAFAAVKRSEPTSLLVVAGDGEQNYVASLHKMARELAVAENILWTGFLGPDEKPAAFAAATVFVLPSHSENFGIVAAEALFAGVPTLLTDRVAIAPDMAAADAAIVVPAEEYPLCSALLRMLTDDQLRQRLSRNGRTIAANLFSSQSVGSALATHYQQIRDAAEKVNR